MYIYIYKYTMDFTNIYQQYLEIGDCQCNFWRDSYPWNVAYVWKARSVHDVPGSQVLADC